MKKIIVTQSNYIPWKGYFDAINHVDELILLDDLQFTRRDWRNRNKIKTAQGTQWITIPVEVKGRYFQKIEETRVSDQNWGKDHWKIIKHNYSKAKYFEEYQLPFERAYLHSAMELLSEVNYTFIKIICGILKIETPIKWSRDFETKEGRTERLVHICKQAGATDYYSGPAAKAYLEESLFVQEGIAVHYFDYSGYKPYRQLYGEFVHEVSIIDLLFNEGPNSKSFMKTFD